VHELNKLSSERRNWTKMNSAILETPDAVIVSHQRSGTHFLASSLASHPKIHDRGEFVLRHQRGQPSDDGTGHHPAFTNLPNHLNIGIVMYSEAERFERLCRRLNECKVIHLLRNPRDVAVSQIQMEADRARLGIAFRAHYRIADTPPEPAPIDVKAVEGREKAVRSVQRTYANRFKLHCDILTVSYDEITNNCQVNIVPEPIAVRILSFLGLTYSPLTTTLRKTGAALG
jgi:hypothetical protein